MTNKKYAIVNDVDRPEGKLVTEIVEGKHYYMSRYFDDSKKNYDGMQPRNPTFLEDFGFDIVEKEYQTEFIQTGESKATYKDGEQRRWQGEKEFVLPKVIL